MIMKVPAIALGLLLGGSFAALGAEPSPSSAPLTDQPLEPRSEICQILDNQRLGMRQAAAAARIRQDPESELLLADQKVDEVIVLGWFPDEPYVVVVPGRDRDRLSQVRRCMPDAMILPSRRGSYIHAASFRDRASAEKLSDYLREEGFDARVAYFQPSRRR